MAEKNGKKPQSRKIPDLYALLDDSRSNDSPTEEVKEKNPIFPDFSSNQADRQKTGLSSSFPPELEIYLSPNLLRKLKQTPPPRGALFNALDRLRSIQYQLTTYLPSNLVQEKLSRPVPGLVKGQLVQGSLLFADVSGFTALSEQLAALGLEGAEKLTEIMNRYFNVMLDILSRSGGILIKFAGDATLVYFPHQRQDRQAGWAARAGWRMLRAMHDFQEVTTPQGKTSLQMKVGIATGRIYLGSIGSAERMEYAISGETVQRIMQAEGMAKTNQLIADAATRDSLQDSGNVQEVHPGFYQIALQDEQTLDDFEIKAEKRRARGPLTWQLSVEAAVEQMTTAIHQIEALSPYLPKELVDRIVVHAKKRRIESEYRPTTVLFCNFTGPESLLSVWDERGISRITALLSAYYNTVHDVVDHYGGIISRIDPYTKGTKLLILFGAPIMHEDDPIRAVNAALAMKDQLDDLNQRWARKFHRHLPPNFRGPLIQQRFGITQGLTFAGQVGSNTRHEYTVMGDDVNLAARLMSAAAWGQILISPRVQEIVNGHFFETQLQAIRVKGKTKPIPISQVDGKREDTLLLRIREAQPIFGRDDEIEAALGVVTRETTNQPRILIVQGPPGIGKSHFSDHILRQILTRGYEPILLTGEEFTKNIDRHGVQALFNQIFKTTQDEKRETRAVKVQNGLAPYPLEPEHFQTITRLMDVDIKTGEDKPTQSTATPDNQKTDKPMELWDQLAKTTRDSFLAEENIFKQQGQNIPTQKIHAALASLFQHVLKDSRLVFYLENGDWFDQPSKDLLISLIKSLPPEKTLLIINQRQSPARDVARAAHSIHLGPLPPAGALKLTAHILLDNLSSTMYDQTHGIPLFIREISEYIQRNLSLTSETLAKMLHSSNFMQQLVLSRLEILPEEQREIVRLASVIGLQFRFGEIRALSGSEIDPVTLSNQLRSLVSAGLIDLIESGADARYAFQQPHVQEAIYQSLPYDRRRELHQELGHYLARGLDSRRAAQNRIASFLGSEEETDPVSNLEKIAHHFELGEDILNAARMRLDSALQAREHGQISRARENLRKGLVKITPPLTPEKNRLQQKLLHAEMDLWMLQGKYREAIQTLTQIKALTESAGPALSGGLILKEVLCRAALDRSMETLDLALSNLTQQELARLSGVIALWIKYRDNPIPAKQDPEIAKEIENNDLIHEFKGVLSELREAYETSLTYYEAAGADAKTAIVLVHLGDEALATGEYAQARKRYALAHTLFENLNESCGVALCTYRLAELAHQEGQSDTFRNHLTDFEKTLANCPSEIFREGAAILNQLRQDSTPDSPMQFPTWHWHHFTDRITIDLFLSNGLLLNN